MQRVIPCNSCNVSYHLTCLNLTSIPSGQFWWRQECVENSSIENNDTDEADYIDKADSLGPIVETNETPRGSLKRKREENRNKMDKDNFRSF